MIEPVGQVGDGGEIPGRHEAARWGGRCHHLGVEILEPQTRAQRQTIGDMPRVLHVEPEVGIQPVGVERRRVEDLHRVRDTVSIALVEIGVDGGIVLTEFPEPPLPARFERVRARDVRQRTR